MNAMVDSAIEIGWMFKAFNQGIGVLLQIDQILKKSNTLEKIRKCYTNSKIDEKKGRITFHYLWAPLYIKIRLYRYIASDLPRYGVLLDWGFLDSKGEEIDPEFTVKRDIKGILYVESEKDMEISIDLSDEFTYSTLADLFYKLLSTRVEDRTSE